MNKYGAKKVTYDGITFDSTMERDYYKHLLNKLNSKEIKFFELQPEFELQEAFVKNGKKYKAITYRADFMVINNDDSIDVIDVKGHETEVFNLKKKMFHFKYEYPLLLLRYDGSKGKWINIDEPKTNNKNIDVLKDFREKQEIIMNKKDIATLEYLVEELEISEKFKNSLINHIIKNYDSLISMKNTNELDLNKYYKNKIKVLQNMIW